MKLKSNMTKTHKNHFYQNKSTQNHYNLHGICMNYKNLTICIHIPNIKESIKDICMEARDSRVYMYIY